MSLLIPVSAHFGAQYSVCSDIREAIKNIEKKLSPGQLQQFRKTPIGHFMGIKNLQFSGQIIHQMLLLLVEDQPDDEFWILRNGEIVKFTFNDWCRITGLPNTKRYPALNDKELGQSSLCHTFLGGEVTKCTFKHVREKYVAAENNMDSEKMVDFSMLYFIESVLLAKDRSTCIESTHLHLVEEPKKFKSYPWAWESYLLTIRHMKSAMDGQPEKFENKSKETSNYKSLKYTFYGFPLPIQVWAYECFPELVEKNLALKEGTSSCEIINWASKKFPKVVTLKDIFFRDLQQKKNSDADTLRAIRDLRKRIDGVEVKVDAIKQLLVEVVMKLNSSGRRRRSVRIQRQKRARTKAAAAEDDEDSEEDDEIEEGAEKNEEETGSDEDADEPRENKEESMEIEDDTEETGENEEENALGENEDTEQNEDEHSPLEKSHKDEDRAEMEGTAEHEPQDNMFEEDSHMVEVDDKEDDDLDEDKLLMELTLNKEKLLGKGKPVINEPLQKRKRQKSKYYCSPFTDPRPHNVSPTTIELHSKGVGHVNRDFFRDLIDQEKWLSNDHLEAIMDNMLEVLNGIERKNYTAVGPVFVNHLLRMSADECVWSNDKFLRKFDWSGVEKIFLPVNGDGRH
ncbi:unnamed protein product [Cuscuta campestris]|uniref:DUF1985 domain-containing protein n=1 Tax=Cuscuta campestris TaxID=132261 RepID=A0A484LYU2_9ASTE|nr:unnamed protein product [Cuscuta campestris]